MNERTMELAKNIMKIDDYDRYRFFVERIVDTEEVWVLSQDDRIISIELENGKDFFPVWAVKEMAEANNKGLLEGSTAIYIDLPYFMNEILDKAIRNKDIIAPNYDMDTDDYDCLSQRLMKKAISSELKKKKNWYRKHENIREDDMDSTIDFKKNLNDLRINFKKDVDKEYYFYEPPFWLLHDDPLKSYFSEAEDIRKNGKILYAYIWQCDESLFDKYPREDNPAIVIYGEDSLYEDEPDRLREVGEKVEMLNSSDIMPGDIKILFDEFSSDKPRPMKIKLPPEIAGEHDLWLTTLIVHKKHLPEGMLFRRIVPLVVGQSSNGSTVLPEFFWYPLYKKYYTSLNEVDISHKMEPVQSEETVKNNDKLLSMSDDEKYDFFIKEVCKNETVWTLEEDSSPAGLGDEDGVDTFLFWPTEELATMNRTEYFKDFYPMAISVYEFIAKWLPIINMRKDRVSLYYYKKDEMNVDTLKLRDDLEREILKDE